MSINRVLLDADLLLEFAMNRPGYSTNENILLEMSRAGTIDLYITDKCLAKLYFYLSKFNISANELNINIKEITKNYTPTRTDEYIKDARRSSLKDFDSALEVACAIANKFDAIVTQNSPHFTGTDFPIWKVDNLSTIQKGLNDRPKILDRTESQGVLLDTDLAKLKAFIANANRRLDVVNRITSNHAAIVAKTVVGLVEEQPKLIEPGGGAYPNRRMAACLRDTEIILRYVTYAMLAGEASVLDDRCLNGLRETYLALRVPCGSVAASTIKMKYATIAIANDPNDITKGECSSLIAELSSYFDRVAAAVS
jgi:phycocyanin beta chain